MLRHPNVRRPLASLLLGLTLGSCYDWRVDARPVTDVIGRGSEATVRVHLKDGTHPKDARTIDVVDVVVTSDTLRGIANIGGSRVSIPVQDIESVSTQHLNRGKSAAAAAVPFLLVGIFVVASGMRGICLPLCGATTRTR